MTLKNKLSIPALAGLFAALLSGCALIELPFKLLGFVLNGVMGLLGALINVGSSAAMQVAKFAPIAMLFTQAESAPLTETPCGEFKPALERIAEALEQAPVEMLTVEEAFAAQSREMEAMGLSVVLLDPASLLTEQGRKDFASSLEGRQIRSVRWLQAGSPTSLR